MIKCALPLFMIATCIVGIFADEFCEKHRKLDSECAKYCYQVAKPLLQMAPVCHKKDAEIAELNLKIANLQKKLDEENKCNEFNERLDKQLRILLYLEEREKKGIGEINLNKNVQLGEVQKELSEEYRVNTSNRESSNLALKISNQKVEEDVKQFNNFSKYINTCLKSSPGVDTTGSVEIEGIEAFSVHCVNDLNSGPGWMLIQKRTDKQATNYFNHDWPQYRNGFGDFNAGFFIGLEKLYCLTNVLPHELYIDMVDWDGNKTFAHYDNFRVGRESEQYPLKDLGNYTSDSNAGDALRDNNNMKFSTWGRDNDNSPDIDCAHEYSGGWWHNNCTKANLNGWQHATNEYKVAGIWWLSHVPLKEVRMLIRPKMKK